MDIPLGMVRTGRRVPAPLCRERFANARRYAARLWYVNRIAGRAAAVVVSLALCTPRDAPAQDAPGDTTVAREIAPGVTLRRIVRAAGPVVMQVLEVDLRLPALTVRAVRACDRGSGRERPSAIARRLRADGIDVVAAINAGFFDLGGGTGISESNIVVDGEIAKAVERTESPFDRFDNVHSQFGFTESRRPVIDRFRLSGMVRSARGSWPLGAVNGSPVANAAALYTRWSDRPPRFPSAMRSSAVPLERIARDPTVVGARATARYRVLRSASRDTTADSIGIGVLLVGTGTAADGVARLRAGDIVSVDARFTPDRGPLRALVGGWPRIVSDGMDVSAAADTAEGTSPRFASNRHPRSVVGFSRDSATLYLGVVDGRQTSSVGMTLGELAQAMIAIGAHDALNLDGGGSTALVIGDSVVNRPSDAAGERPVGDALIVTRESPIGRAAWRSAPARTVPASCVVSSSR